MHFLSLSPIHHLVLAWAWARFYVVKVVMSGVVGALTSIAQSFPRKGRVYSRVWRYRQFHHTGALTLSSRGVPCWVLIFGNAIRK